MYGLGTSIEKKKAKGILQLLSPAIQHIVSWKSPNAITYGLFWSLCKYSLNQGWQAWNKKNIRPTTTMSRTFTLQVLILLMEEIPANQLRLAVYPTIYESFIHPRWLLGISSINSSTEIVGFSPLCPAIAFPLDPFRTYDANSIFFAAGGLGETETTQRVFHQEVLVGSLQERRVFMTKP